MCSPVHRTRFVWRPPEQLGDRRSKYKGSALVTDLRDQDQVTLRTEVLIAVPSKLGLARMEERCLLEKEGRLRQEFNHRIT